MGGTTYALQAPLIAGELAAVSGTPDVIIINLGANDIGGVLVEATLKADVRTVLDAAHAYAPNAEIYLTQIDWGSGTPGTAVATFNGWQADVRGEAAYSWFTFLGYDEGELAAGDWSDSKHKNHSGHVKEAIGYSVIIAA